MPRWSRLSGAALAVAAVVAARFWEDDTQTPRRNVSSDLRKRREFQKCGVQLLRIRRA